MEIQSIYQQAIKFAAAKHAENNQLIPGSNLPYVVHLSNVAMEVLLAYQSAPVFKLEDAIQLALLHDTLEDTSATFDEITYHFGAGIAAGVAALTKNETLPKAARMEDSLNRIQAQPKETAVVKLADRITNMQEPPQHWSKEKRTAYRQEALLILHYLKNTNPYLEDRLHQKLTAYEQYLG